MVIVFHRCRSLNSNKFSGSIPASLGRLSNLYWFDLADNKLSGGLPVFDGTNPGLDNLTNTKHLYVPVLVPRIKFIDIILGSDILIPLKSCGSFDGRFFAATSGSISSQEQYRARFSTQIWRWYMCKWEETHTTWSFFVVKASSGLCSVCMQASWQQQLHRTHSSYSRPSQYTRSHVSTKPACHGKENLHIFFH